MVVVGWFSKLIRFSCVWGWWMATAEVASAPVASQPAQDRLWAGLAGSSSSTSVKSDGLYDARQIEPFIDGTNCLVLLGHGLTTLGRTISEAYHRLTAFTSEVRRNILAEQLAALKGTRVAYRSQAEVERMYRLAEQVIYPDRAEDVMT